MKMTKEYQEAMRKKAELLKAIAHPVRLCLTRKLYENGKCNVTYFTDCLETSQSNISQHLEKLTVKKRVRQYITLLKMTVSNIL